MIVQVTRFILFLAGALVGLEVAQSADWTAQIGYPEYYVLFIFIVLGGSIGFLLGSIVGRELTTAFQRLEERLRDLSMIDLILGTVGLALGMAIALVVSYPLRVIQPQALAATAVLTSMVLAGWAGARVALLKRADASRAFPRLAGSDLAAVPSAAAKILDTSAVIDGRFVELRRAGFLEGPVQVPRFVLAELQTLADSADDVRRARGRRGLDLLSSLQGGEGRVDVFEIDYPNVADVDTKLVRLAQDSGGAIVTVDYNLAGVARASGAAVLNVNEIAAALRPMFLPGESLQLTILREGKESDQGVGYLEDGTMVVVAGGREHVGVAAEAEVTSVLQTSSGRMVFAKMGRVL